MFLIDIQISKDDGKAQYICDCCETTIKLAARLKETAETTQWRLQQELEIGILYFCYEFNFFVNGKVMAIGTTINITVLIFNFFIVGYGCKDLINSRYICILLLYFSG